MPITAAWGGTRTPSADTISQVLSTHCRLLRSALVPAVRLPTDSSRCSAHPAAGPDAEIDMYVRWCSVRAITSQATCEVDGKRRVGRNGARTIQQTDTSWRRYADGGGEGRSESPRGRTRARYHARRGHRAVSRVHRRPILAPRSRRRRTGGIDRVCDGYSAAWPRRLSALWPHLGGT